MGYSIEISINMLKENKFLEVETVIYDKSNTYNCENIYSLAEEDGTGKIPRYYRVYVISFLNDNLDGIIKFINFVKKYKSCYIECVYENNINKLLYASSFYLNNIEKDISKKYKEFINNKNFTPIEIKLLKELI